MNSFVDLSYQLVLLLIHSYKWAEFQFLQLISSWLRRKGKEMCASIGVILHCPSDPEWTEADTKKALQNCNYDYLVHLKVNHDSFFARAANMGTLGVGETYMEKVWEHMESEEDVVEFVKRVFENDLLGVYQKYPVNRFLHWLEYEAFNLQTKQRALQVGKEHYDLGNDLFQLMLDPWMQYTCGYWAAAKDLNQAQLDKMDLIARKLDLKPGMRVLDIGCGWGYLCKYLAENYQVECVGVSISKEGVEHGKEICRGLPVEFRFQDYRELDGKFDRIVSVGMFEHVGNKNYREFMQIAHDCLKDDGIFLLHTIGSNHPTMMVTDGWMLKYIFPNGRLPRAHDITKDSYELFIIEDWHNFGLDYAKTLHGWRDNLTENWDKISLKYGDTFYRMWIFYLTSCEAAFLARKPQLWQIVMSKVGLKGGYRAPR